MDDTRKIAEVLLGDAEAKLIFPVFAALAEFERELIRERTHDGLASARARGRVGGRPTVRAEEKRALAQTTYKSREHDVSTIARTRGVSRAGVYRLENSHSRGHVTSRQPRWRYA